VLFIALLTSLLTHVSPKNYSGADLVLRSTKLRCSSKTYRTGGRSRKILGL